MTSNISPIQRDPAQRQCLIEAIEQSLPVSATVIGLVEIGSFAKDEAVPTSDTDTRAYIRAADETDLLVMANQRDPVGFGCTVERRGEARVYRIPYERFNEQLRSQVGGSIENRVSAGFIDVVHAEVLFEDMDRLPSQDHSMLFQSAIVYDPDNWIARWRSRLKGIATPALIAMYRTQVMIRTFEQLPSYAATPGAHRGAHQWLLQAVRCIREATSLKSFAATGEFLFRKIDVLSASTSLSPTSRDLIAQLYDWKCDPKVREEIPSSIGIGERTWPRRYAELTPAVQEAVAELLIEVPE
jgi:hypothetical protein